MKSSVVSTTPLTIGVEMSAHEFSGGDSMETRQCPKCHGFGGVHEDGRLFKKQSPPICDLCNGSGTVRVCPTCDTWGIDTLHNEKTGRTDHINCPQCKGRGYLAVEVEK
jgi:DnaJ-class molecular chaperone